MPAPTGGPILTVLLEVAALELDVQAGLDPTRDHPCPVAEWRRWRGTGEFGGERQAHSIWAAQVEVVADDALEEAATPARFGKDLGQADLHLPQAQAMPIAGGTISRRQWPGQPLEPAVEQRLHVGGTERVTHLLEAGRVGAPAEAIVQGLKRDAL